MMWKTLKGIEIHLAFKVFRRQNKEKNYQQRTDHTSILVKCIWKVPTLKDRVCKDKNQVSISDYFFSAVLSKLLESA